MGRLAVWFIVVLICILIHWAMVDYFGLPVWTVIMVGVVLMFIAVAKGTKGNGGGVR